MLYRFGFGYVWQQQSVGDEAAFLSTFRQRLRDNYRHTWHSNLENSRKSITYKHFKIDMSPCAYLQIEMN